MRFLVGILYSNEAEFDECLVGIQMQQDVMLDYFIVMGKPKRQAHDELYDTFMRESARYDLFVKVDADMVIENSGLFARIADKFATNEDLDMLTIDVYDFFSDRLIDGLHTFRNTVKWIPRENEVFTDSHSVPADRRHYDRTELAPAAIHCKNPSPFQAFHYGLHRATKILAKLNLPDAQQGNLTFHLENRDRVWQHYLHSGDVRLAYASLGCELTLRGRFDVEHVAYSEPYAEEVFRESYSSLSHKQLEWRVRMLRLINDALLPPTIGINRRQSAILALFRRYASGLLDSHES